MGPTALRALRTTEQLKCLAQGHKKRRTNFWHHGGSNPRLAVIHVYIVWCTIHCATLPSMNMKGYDGIGGILQSKGW